MPFCCSRCIYCDFFSTTALERRQEYVEGVCREMALKGSGEPVATVYLGGGTPSTLSNAQLGQILDSIDRCFSIEPGAEITLEANPDDVTEELLRGLPVNRLSMGVQSFCDERLRLLRRRHTARQARVAIETARRCGISNISIDLIYGLPGQAMEEWRNDVKSALDLPVTHLSAYALSYEEGTLLHRMRERGEVSEACDELSRDMYYCLLDEAEAHGFRHYEISNFALPGCESRHNSSYWTGVPYIGLGPGAHSYDGVSTRRSNACSLDGWLHGEFAEEHLSEDDLFNERVFLSLRTSRGLDTEALERRFPEQTAEIKPLLASLIERGLLVSHPPYVSLSRPFIFISDDIISDLFV